jgi:hypothetical protein
MTSVALKPPTEASKRQQGPCRTASCASIGSRHFSDSHVSSCTGLKALLRQPRYHIATPHCTAGHLLVSIKGGVQGLPRKGGEEGENVHIDTRSHGGGGAWTQYVDVERETRREPHLSLSLALSLSLSLSRDACNPYYEHPGAR